jgi:FAD/FMN-containing dehydrogenase
MRIYRSWGINPSTEQHACVLAGDYEKDSVCYQKGKSVLPYGCGSSYGDVCLNSNGVLLDTQRLDRFLEFDQATGILRCEAGVTLRQINQIFVPQGWFLPVTPGTQNVTVGGAVANDVHGKNHHQAGSFGCHIRKLGLFRSAEGYVECGQINNPQLFKATIAGLGLTGLIIWCEFQLKPISGPFIKTKKVIFNTLDEFEGLTGETSSEYEYTVAWIDSVASQKKIGKGVFFCGNHAETKFEAKSSSKRKISIPFNAPSGLLNYSVVKLFNAAYFNLHKFTSSNSLSDFESFFYPLDNVKNWNRLYGKKGFFQYQCVVPVAGGIELVGEMLEICSRFSQGSFLSVLKKFGDIRSPGIMSFPRSGYTLALDFRNLGDSTYQLFVELDKLVFENNGAIYSAKDARMSPENFKKSYPGLNDFCNYIDPVCSSDFSRRVMPGEFC